MSGKPTKLPPAQGKDVAQLDEFTKMLDRRGVNWKLMIGITGSGPGGGTMSPGPTIAVTLNGDAAPIPAVSIVGAIAAGESVIVIFVPPRGYYIIGHCDSQNVDPGWLDFVNVGSMSFTTSGTTELDLTNLAVSAYIVADRHYELWMQALFAQSLASDRYVIQARQNSTGGTIVGNANFGALAVNSVFMFPFTATNTGMTTFHFSVQRNLGTGTVAANGSPGASAARTWAGIKQGVRASVYRSG